MNKAKIIIVEDERILALNLEKLLNKAGYDVCAIVSSGEGAIEKAKTQCPDIILMDIHINGELDGIETAKRIRSFLDVPIVYITAFSDEETINRAKETEPNAFLLKPFEFKNLQVTIDMCLAKHQSEIKRKEHAKWLSSVLQGIGDGVVTTNPSGLVTFFNPKAQSLLGWERQEILGQPVQKVLNLVGMKEYHPVQFMTSETPIFELSYDFNKPVYIQREDGVKTPVEVYTAPLKEQTDQTTGRIIVLRDMGQRRKLEEERQLLSQKLYQTQKMEAIGQFARGVAHDFNNFLMLIGGLAEMQLQENRKRKVNTEWLTKILQVVDKSNALTQSLLLFCRDKTMHTQTLEINRLLKGLENLLKCIANGKIRFACTYINLPLSVEADQIALEQAVINLVLNARDAMPNGGQITIRTAVRSIPRASAGSDADKEPGDYACIDVRDTGIGMDRQTLDKVFQPFFTTKETGTGLGLSAVYGIAKRFNGFLDVLSESGKGTSIQICIPLQRGAAENSSMERARLYERQDHVELLQN